MGKAGREATFTTGNADAIHIDLEAQASLFLKYARSKTRSHAWGRDLARCVHRLRDAIVLIWGRHWGEWARLLVCVLGACGLVVLRLGRRIAVLGRIRLDAIVGERAWICHLVLERLWLDSLMLM
jgi:hypothetical protein